MSVQQIKCAFLELIDEHQKIDPYELRRIFTEAIREWEMNKGWNEGSRGDPWTDDELRVVLSDAPTKGNCLKACGGLSGGDTEAVEQIYRWAASSEVQIRQRGRQDDAFIQQVKRVAKQLGWPA